MATETSRSPTVAVYVGAALLVLGGVVFGYVEYLNRHAPPELELTTEARAYLPQLKLADATMSAHKSYLNQMLVEIQGNIANNGDRPLDTVEIFCVFRDAANQTIAKKRVAIVGGGRTGGLKPGETKPFRLAFDDLPDTWNQAMPNLVIAGIKFS